MSFKNKFCFYLLYSVRRSLFAVQCSAFGIQIIWWSIRLFRHFVQQYNWHSWSINSNESHLKVIPLRFRWVHQCEILMKTTDMNKTTKNKKKLIINEINKKNINECQRIENKNLKIKGFSVQYSVWNAVSYFYFWYFFSSSFWFWSVDYSTKTVH